MINSESASKSRERKRESDGISRFETQVFESLADEVDSYSQLQLFPLAVGGIDRSLECDCESQASAIP
jgi:hypothetical protein